MIIPTPAGLAPDAPLGDEGYRLTVRDGEATIEADTDAGRFYAEQTLARLGTERDVEIADRPRYAWRGFMLDVSRHFFGVEDVRRVIDHLAAYKLNVLHLHLSDDQGWRLVIDSWPRLAEHGGQTAVGGGPGGFFTKDDYAAIVEYAAERFITVVPEIDMPGHTQAAIASYPELAPEGASHELYTRTGVGSSSLDCHSATTYRWVEDVLRELAEMTPGPYLHIGGDEAHSTTREDYLAFMERVQPIVAGLGKRLVGWEEIATAPLDANAIVQYWHTGPAEGVELIQRAAAGGAQVILSPGKHIYLDQKYDEDTELGPDLGRLRRAARRVRVGALGADPGGGGRARHRSLPVERDDHQPRGARDPAPPPARRRGRGRLDAAGAARLGGLPPARGRGVPPLGDRPPPDSTGRLALIPCRGASAQRPSAALPERSQQLPRVRAQDGARSRPCSRRDPAGSLTAA